MFGLIRFEMRKLLMRISLAVMIVIMLAMCYLNLQLPDLVGGMLEGVDEADEMLGALGLFQATADTFLVKALVSGDVSLIMTILIAVFATQDYRTRTMKNIISRGFGREKVFLARLIVIWSCAILFCLLTMGFTYGMAMLKGCKSGMPVTELCPLLATQILSMMALCTFFYVMAVLTRSVGGALAVGILSGSFIPLLTRVADTLLKNKNAGFTIHRYSVFSFEEMLSHLP